MRALKQHNHRALALVLLLALTIALMFMLKKCSYNRQSIGTDIPSSGDTLDVAIEYSPLSLYTYNDTLGGFNYDLMRLIATHNKLKIKFHPIVSLTEALVNLQNGNYDILLAELPMTTEYKDTYLFTEPVYLDRQVLVQLKDSITSQTRISTQLDLAGDTVWVVANSPFVYRISNLAREIGDTIYVETDSVYSAEQLFILTATKEIKQAVINERIAKLMVQDYPQVDINTNISFTQFQSWLLNKNDSTLCDSLNIWLHRVKSSDSYKALESKYLK